jgi:hypothetical protein
MTRYEKMQLDLTNIREKYARMHLIDRTAELEARRAEFDSALARAINDIPDLTHKEIASQFGCDPSYVAAVAVKYECRRPKGRGSKAWKDQR